MCDGQELSLPFFISRHYESPAVEGLDYRRYKLLFRISDWRNLQIIWLPFRITTIQHAILPYHAGVYAVSAYGTDLDLV